MNRKKQLAAELLNTAASKIHFAPAALEEIKKAITRSDLRGLIAVGKISVKPSNQQSRGRARTIASQKRKGRQRGRGSHKGTRHSIVTRKESWITKVRAQRRFLAELAEKKIVSTTNYHQLYAKSKGGYFRSIRHIKLYIAEHHLAEKNNPQK